MTTEQNVANDQPDTVRDAPQNNNLLQAVPETTEQATTPNALTDWTHTFSEEHRAKPYLKDFKSADDLLKSYENQRSLIGKRIEDASPEQLVTIREKLGVPKAADAYKLTLPEDRSKEGVDEQWFREAMLEAHVPENEANVLFNKYAELVATQRQAYEQREQQTATDARHALDKAWGPATDARLKGVVNFIQERGGDEILEIYNKSNLKNSAQFVQFLGSLAELHAEHKGVNLSASSSWGTTPSEAQAQINAMKSDPDFIKKVSNDADFKQKWMRLHELATA
jgi:hypothetical protein